MSVEKKKTGGEFWGPRDHSPALVYGFQQGGGPTKREGIAMNERRGEKITKGK